MAKFLIGYFSRRQVFHIVAYRDSQEEVGAFLKTHNRHGLVVYASQQSVQPTCCTCAEPKLLWKESSGWYCGMCYKPARG